MLLNVIIMCSVFEAKPDVSMMCPFSIRLVSPVVMFNLRSRLESVVAILHLLCAPQCRDFLRWTP